MPPLHAFAAVSATQLLQQPEEGAQHWLRLLGACTTTQQQVMRCVCIVSCAVHTVRVLLRPPCPWPIPHAGPPNNPHTRCLLA